MSLLTFCLYVPFQPLVLYPSNRWLCTFPALGYAEVIFISRIGAVLWLRGRSGGLPYRCGEFRQARKS